MLTLHHNYPLTTIRDQNKMKFISNVAPGACGKILTYNFAFNNILLSFLYYTRTFIIILTKNIYFYIYYMYITTLKNMNNVVMLSSYLNIIILIQLLNSIAFVN